MLRPVVSVSSLSLAMLIVACSDATTSPAVSRAFNAAVIESDSGLPFYPGARVGVITALDHAPFPPAPTAINDYGEVVGWGNTGSGSSDQSFKWKSDLGLTIHGNGTVEDTAQSIAVSVNNSGQVLLQGPGGSVEIWDWFGNITHLRDLSAFSHDCNPYGILDNGTAIGICQAGNYSVATGWTKSGNPDALLVNGSGLIRVNAPFALGFSNAGYVTGTLFDTPTGFVFTPTKQLENLPTPTLSGFTVQETHPVAINDNGQAVGYVSGGGACFDRAIAWLTPATATDLGFCGVASGITDDGLIFGNVQTANPVNPTFTAVVRSPSGTLYRLPGLEGGAALAKEQSAVAAINHSHQAVGSITTSTGVGHVVIWTLPAL